MTEISVMLPSTEQTPETMRESFDQKMFPLGCLELEISTTALAPGGITILFLDLAYSLVGVGSSFTSGIGWSFNWTPRHPGNLFLVRVCYFWHFGHAWLHERLLLHELLLSH